MGIVIAGIVMSIAASAVVRNRTRVRSEAWLAERAEIVRAAISDTVLDLAGGLDAAGAFIELSAPISQDEYAEFVNRLDSRLSLVAVAYLPIVHADELAALEEMMQRDYPGYEVRKLIVAGDTMPDLAVRDTYFPVQYLVSGEFLDSVVPTEDGSPSRTPAGATVEADINQSGRAPPHCAPCLPLLSGAIVVRDASLNGAVVGLGGPGSTQTS